MNWTKDQATELSGRVNRYRIHDDDRGRLSFRQVIDLWMTNEVFRSWYISLLQDSSYSSYYWEHPLLTSALLDREYEFVLVQSDILHTVVVAPQYFDDYYKDNGEVVVFPNLGLDALLIVPSPINDVAQYTHFAQFARMGDTSQLHSFLTKIGETLVSSLPTQRVWLNTSGLGVYYVHVRLDMKPKYYTYLPYKKI